MKTKSIIFALLACIGFTMTSCEDMLSPDSERHAGWDQVASDTLYGYWGVLKSLQNLGERYVILGEARGDMVDMTNYTTDSIASIADFRNPQDGECRYLRASDFYAVINNCNAYLAAADTDRPIYGVSSDGNKRPKYMSREYAQVWTIRAWVYLQLVQLYGNVPFYTHPLMSTDDVEKFYNSGNCQKADRYNLKDLIAASADKVSLEDILEEYYPQYGNYNDMVHSMFCFFPPRVVMGDICLAGAQSKSDYMDAARHYFRYLERYSAFLPYDSYYCSASKASSIGSQAGEVVYSTSGQRSIFNVSGSTPSSASNKLETITVIPSTTNKLWGIIQRGVNEVFGFSSDVSVSTSANDTTTSATVVLSFEPEQQLVASEGFKSLCRQYPTLTQRYKVSSSGSAGSTTGKEVIGYDTIITNTYAASDARRGWSDEYSVYDAGGTRHNNEYIMKQNPGGAFSTTYPVIYRKATVWLRLAEALNRAGFSEHAFAILADGLSKDLMPQADKDYYCFYHELRDTITDYTEVGHNPVHRYANLADAQAAYDADPSLYGDNAPKAYIIDTLSIEKFNDAKYKPYIAQGIYFSNSDHPTFHTGEYIPFDQALLAAENPDILGFDKQAFNLEETSGRGHGIHARGSGMKLVPECTGIWTYAEDGVLRDSVMNEYYNFDLCVRQYWPEFKRMNKYADGVTDADYQEYRDKLMLAVEDLIIDEMGLELCFEGHRFNDLVRVATRRNQEGNKGSEWLAKKIASRSGSQSPESTELYSKLLNTQNWYLQLPNQ